MHTNGLRFFKKTALRMSLIISVIDSVFAYSNLEKVLSGKLLMWALQQRDVINQAIWVRVVSVSEFFIKNLSIDDFDSPLHGT
jgi:hypothetical protein